MASRPRRSAAQKASVAITDMADRDNMSSSRSRRSGDGLASVSRGSQGGKDHTYLTVKLPSSKLRQATSSKQGSSISVNNDSTPKRSTRGGKKSYVVESESDEEEEEGEDEIQVGAPAVVAGDEEDEEMEDVDEDAEGEEIDEEMELDAEGEEDEDAEGEEDVDMAPPAPAPIIKIQKPTKKSPESKRTKDITPKKASAQAAALNDSDDEELSELESDEEMEGEEDAEGEEDDEEMDAEGEEIEEDQDAEGEPEPNAEAGQEAEEIDSDDESAAPGGKTRMTVRQRARFEELDESHYQALSNEVQAKKVFTVEEKAMRRAEMARRRRNLSEKRNEEVKQETINKLLKKQASKTNRKGGHVLGEDGLGEGESRKPNPIFIRWVSTKDGERVSVPEEILEGPTGRLFANAVRPTGAGPTGLAGPRKMVEEVS
ncbi:hypothetical protein Daus18300_012828 [Diaporthe australafricana]|uniref:INO80 complex subunit B-like conserved region domain-containing protein n=1 Tax=Diaporthe australafricana TaxID=127596 RepID=A0ABR3W172_9PEZI